MDVGGVLLDILVLLVAAKLAAELAERVGLPGVVAEIAAGILIGPSVGDLVRTNETLAVLGELGVILLLLQVGLEMDLRELRAVGRAAISVASVGVVVPMVLGFGAMRLLDYSDNTALFLGAALAATSVGITARVFSDLRALATVEARTVLAAAVADDVIGLVVLTVVVRIVATGTISVGSLAGIVAVAIGFLVAAATVGARIAPPVFQWLQHQARSSGTVVALALAFTLGFAELADAAKLAPIVGAFVAGVALSRSEVQERISRELAPVGHLLIPVFFLQIGIAVRVEKFVSPDVLGVAAVLLVCAVVGKIVATVGALGAPGDKLLIGLGMIPRGEVGLIFATIGLQEGVLGNDLYAALLLVVLVTTIMAPPLLRWRLLRMRRHLSPLAPSERMPEQGWLQIDDRTVELGARPPEHLALPLGLEAALALAREGTQPGSLLLDWIGSLGDTALRWDPDATRLLFAVLTRGSPRSWRFLETTGLLERALPELAQAVERRRVDPLMLEAAHLLRFALVERVHLLEGTDAAAATQLAQLVHREWLLLAALILDAAGDDAEPVPLARRLVHRLDLGAAAEEEIALLVGDPDLLHAAARRIDAFEEEKVVQIATHLDTPECARALFVLTIAREAVDSWERGRIDELFAQIITLLAHPAISGKDARNLVERRRTEAISLVNGSEHVIERIEHAPRAYILAQTPPDVARHALLLEPIPVRNAARVTVSALAPDEWRIEAAIRDRPGLLAMVSGVLAAHGLDVLEAVVATWPDGAALESFRVQRTALEPAQFAPDALERAQPPQADSLETSIVSAFRQPLVAPPNPDALIVFDDAASPWYTLCEVRSPDRRGLLHTITVGIASAGADVHSARLASVDGMALDRFELTDHTSSKLDAATQDAIVSAITNGVADARASLTGRRSRVFGRWPWQR